MSTVLFFNISGHRLGVRLFLAPPRQADREGEQRRGSQVDKDKSRQTEGKYKPEVERITDLLVAIKGVLGAISWTKTLLELKSVNPHAFASWKSSLEEVIHEGSKLLKFLKKENLLPEYLKHSAGELLEIANELYMLLETISQNKPDRLQNSLDLVTEAQKILKDVVEKIQDLLKKAT